MAELLKFGNWREKHAPVKSKWDFDLALQEAPEPKLPEGVANITYTGPPTDGHTYIAKIDMTVEQWQDIKGIGPKLAERLVENGPYGSVAEVEKVKGISKKIVDQILAVPLTSAAYASSGDVPVVEDSSS